MGQDSEAGGREPIDGEAYHTQEEIDGFNERAELIGDYAELVSTAADETMREFHAVEGPDRHVRRHALFQQHRWLDALLFVLLVALVALVAAFYISGNDFTESLSSDESTPAETETSAQGGEDQAADGDVAESEVDDAGAAGTTEGDVAGTQPAEGDLAPLLDLARQVTAYTEAANVAVSADDKKTAYENIRAIGPLMTQYIDAGGDYRMPDFSKAQGEWMLAGNAYVSGDTGAIARMQASYADMVEALSAYEAEAASSR